MKLTSGRGGGSASNCDINSIVWQMSNEVVTAEKGGQWPLTSFAPIEQRSGLPGWEDFSPEEVRWTLYEAQKNGTVNQALNQISQWYKNAEKARNLVKQRAPEVVNLIVSLREQLNEIINGNQSSYGSRNVFSSTQDAKSTFRFDTSVTNIFGKATTPTHSSGNIFGGSTGGFQTQNVFGSVSGQSSPSEPNNIFTRPQQQQQSSQNTFSSGVSGGQNVFSGNTAGVFGQGFSNRNTANQNIFQSLPATNMFQSTPPAFSGTNSFGGGSNIFGGAQGNVFQQQGVFSSSPFKAETVGFGNVFAKEVDTSVYSKIEDLNENEVTSFTSTTFTFGKIPLKPPPQQYC